MYTSLTVMNIILEGKFCFTETEWICKTSLQPLHPPSSEFLVLINLGIQFFIYFSILKPKLVHIDCKSHPSLIGQLTPNSGLWLVVMSRLAPPSVSGNPHLEQLTRTNIALDVDTFSTCHWSKECISCLQLAKSNSDNYLLETCLILNLNVKLFIHVGYRTVV